MSEFWNKFVSINRKYDKIEEPDRFIIAIFLIGSPLIVLTILYPVVGIITIIILVYLRVEYLREK